MKSVVLEHLSKTYFDPFRGSQVTAVGLSLTIDEGDFVAVVGPGCGKTTVLNMIAGFVPKTRAASCCPAPGKGPTGPGWSSVLRALPWKTVRENVAFGPDARDRQGRTGSHR